jgi:hypothetical protein
MKVPKCRITIYSILLFVPSDVSGSTNLTCINSNITKLANQSINLSMMSEGYFKNLSTDDPELAQLICQYILNHTTK